MSVCGIDLELHVLGPLLFTEQGAITLGLLTKATDCSIDPLWSDEYPP
jgi:hypothetical protein